MSPFRRLRCATLPFALATILVSASVLGCAAKTIYTVDFGDIPDRLADKHARTIFHYGDDYPVVVVRGYKNKDIDIVIKNSRGQVVESRPEHVDDSRGWYEFAELTPDSYVARLHHRDKVKASWKFRIEEEEAIQPVIGIHKP